MVFGAGPVMVHSDVRGASALVPKTTNKSQLLNSHLKVIADLVDGRDVWMPTFNYDFLSTRRYSPSSDVSQVGALNEEFRTRAAWRTSVPVFNFCGSGALPVKESLTSTVDPFDEHSIFAELVRQDGSILWYGAPFSSATFLHHAESVSGGPLYRYDKLFNGEVMSGHSNSKVSLKYHVRPMTGPVDYDWGKIVGHSRESGLISRLGTEQPGAIFVAGVRNLLQGWLERIENDAFYLLDEKSRSWIEPRVRSLGRRFRLEDFEEQTVELT